MHRLLLLVSRSLGAFAFCRAYICFKNYTDIFSFRDRFDNYVFVDAKSNEYAAVVEFAPYQRRPKLSEKKDAKCNTLDQDADYLKFVEEMDKPVGEALPSCEAMLEEIEQREKEKGGSDSSVFAAPKIMTPLLEYLKKKREENKKSSSRGDVSRKSDV